MRKNEDLIKIIDVSEDTETNLKKMKRKVFSEVKIDLSLQIQRAQKC